jgi:hypothetical protein
MPNYLTKTTPVKAWIRGISVVFFFLKTDIISNDSFVDTDCGHIIAKKRRQRTSEA